MAAIPIQDLLGAMIEHRASDIYLTFGTPASLRIHDAIHPQGDHALTDDDVAAYMAVLLNDHQRDEFESTLDLNTALIWNDAARFRINIFRQQAHTAIVIRRIEMRIPTLEELGLPAVYGELILQRRGLVIVVGPTGSGKSTSLASMVGHRNTHGSGHIITVEDPIEFVHGHGQCIISQRDVGLDTFSYSMALKNALRQRPDVVVIGEVRDREVMEQALYFAETGHLCVATLHANNSSQAIERILNFFPEERHENILLNMALNLRGILSQRLVTTTTNTHALALEIMLNNGLIKQLIEENKVRQIKDMIERGSVDGMQTFVQHLLELLHSGTISEEVALAEADNAGNLRMLISNRRSSERMGSKDFLLKQTPPHMVPAGSESF